MNDLFGGAVEEVIEEEYKRPKVPALFDWLTSVNKTKQDLRPKDTELRGYEPFIINTGLGQSEATVGFANLMNRLDRIPKEMHYLFLLYGIPKNNSFAKWAKKTKDDRVKAVMAKLHYNEEKAKEAIWVLGDEGVDKLLNETGGIKNVKRKRKSKSKK